MLDNQSDGIEQITDTLVDFQNLDAVHLISHGSDGSVEIGNTTLDAETLNQNLLEISDWGDAFTEDGDFLIYGCNLAETEDGQSLVQALSSLTHTDVAASGDLTGQAELGGDWVLEYQNGIIESELAVSAKLQQNYEAVLATETVIDNFDSQAYNNNGGTKLWTGDWIETDDGGGGATNGEIYVDGTDLRVRARVDGDNIYREANLSGAISATLTFDVVDNRLTNSDTVRLEVSNDGGGSWSTLKDFTVADPNVSSESFDITESIAANTQIRFLVVGNGDDRIHLDDVQIQYTTSTVAPDNLTAVSSTGGGLSLNEDGGNDAYLIADDGGAILGGLTSLTAEVRFSMQSFPNSTNFFSYATGSDDNVFKFNIRDDGDLSVSINSVKINSSAMDYRTLADGQPHTLSVTWDSAGGVWEMYVDGVAMDNGSGLESGVIIAGGGTLIMGNDQDSVDGGYDPAAEVSATLYDARFFNDVRTATEIANNFDQTLANTESGMLANWMFSDLSLSGVVTDNVSGNNFMISHASGAGFVTSTPTLTLSVSEAAPNSTVVGSVLATDPDTGDSITYSLLDNARGRFAINGSSGQITVADSSLIDFESATSHNITVRVIDSGGLIYDEVFTVSVTDETISTVSASGAATTNAGSVYTLNLAADETATSWTINWGDGTIETIAGNPSSVTHTYVAGSIGLTYDITASATDGSGDHFVNDLIAPTAFQTGEGLYRFDGSIGTFTQAFSGTEVTNPYAAIIGPDGLLYVAGHTSDNVVRYYPETGVYKDTFITAGIDGLNAATGMAFGPDGNLYVSNQIGDSILKYDGITGDFLEPFVNLSSGGLDGPTSIVFRPDGYLYVVSYNTNSVLRYDATTGDFEDIFITAGSGGLSGPGELVWGTDGNIYLGGTNSVIKKFDGSTGAFIKDFVTAGLGGLGEGLGLNFGPDGNLYVASYSTDQIIKYDGTTGALIGDYVAAGTGGLDGPTSFTFLPNQQVLITNTNVAPVLTLPGGVINYTENDAATIIDATATITDGDSGDFDTGTLTIDFSAGGNANDRLAILSTGSGQGQISISGNQVSHEGTLIGTFAGGTDGSTPLVITFNVNADETPVQDLMRHITYQNVSEDLNTTARTVRFVMTDGDGGTSGAVTKTINVARINDAPVLDNSGLMSLTTITEDDLTNNGNLVSKIIASGGGDRITDADSVALEGIAITSYDSSNGTWQYNTGSSWIDVGTVSFSESLLLGANDSLRFVPDGQNADTAFITFSAWDQTSGTAGSKVDTNTYGGTTAFSSVLETAVITKVSEFNK